MIKGIIIVNKCVRRGQRARALTHEPPSHRRRSHGKPRLTKFYQDVIGEEAQQQVIRRVFQQVAQRPDAFCNYLEGTVPEWGDGVKLVYRHYATLYFVFAVDDTESDLGILDLIQVFVEALDKCFENVCELDLIFHSDKVHYVLDEIIMAGMVLETNIINILQAINDQNKLYSRSQKVALTQCVEPPSVLCVSLSPSCRAPEFDPRPTCGCPRAAGHTAKGGKPGGVIPR